VPLTTSQAGRRILFTGLPPRRLPGCLVSLTAAFLAAALTLLPTAARGQDISLNPVERARVRSGRILVREIPNPGMAGKTFEAVGRLPGTLDEALTVITDFRHYAEFMPRIARAEVKDESEHACVVEIRIGLPLGQSRQYRLAFESVRTNTGFVVAWRKVPWPELPPAQTVKDTSGRWLVGRCEEGGLLASYLVYTDPSPVPLGLTAVANAFGRGGVKDVIERVRLRLRTLLAPGRRERPGQNSCP